METFSTAEIPSVAIARRLILARLDHQCGPEWHDRFGDPLSWLEQIYYDLEDDASRSHFVAALCELLLEPGARWAALSLVRILRLRTAAPALRKLAASNELAHLGEGPCGDLQLYLIVALDELGIHEAVPFFQAQLDDPAYAVSACLALLRIDPDLALPHLATVAMVSSEAAEEHNDMPGTIGSVLAAVLRDRDTETFFAMVRMLQHCDRGVRLHTAEALRHQSEIEVRPDLEAEARRLLLNEAR